MKMTMQYAHLSPALLSAEVSLLDPPPPSPNPTKGKKKKAEKRATDTSDRGPRSEVPEFVKDFGSSGWTRTSNPPVNRRKRGVLLRFAARCGQTPERELDSVSIAPIADPDDASVSRPNPRLDVSKGQEKGKVEE